MVASPSIARVVFWMTGTLLSFSAVALSVRALGGVLSIFEMLAIRNGAGLAILLALAVARPSLRAGLAPRRVHLHVVRNLVHYAATYAWAVGIIMLPLATAFALEFTTPAFVALLAVLVLREKLTTARIGAVVLGLAGILVILRPGHLPIEPAALVMVAAAIGFAISLTAQKALTNTESTFSILVWMNIIQLPISLAGSDLSFLGRVEGTAWWGVAGLATAGVASHFCLTQAFKHGDATIVIPLDFLRLPLIAVVGALFYAEPLDPFVFLGAGLIFAGIVWNLLAEARRARPP